jgi:hypothetical protein
MISKAKTIVLYAERFVELVKAAEELTEDSESGSDKQSDEESQNLEN